MGLDMYLEVEVYIPKPQDWMKPEYRAEVKPNYDKALSLLPGKPGDDSYGVTISYSVAYWRKANAIHQWFVNEVQGGKDECQRSYVSREQLKELVALCHWVIGLAKLEDGRVYVGSHIGPDTGGEWVKDYEDGKVIRNAKAVHELLPTSSGFFFGSTEYDEYYIESLQDTIDQIEPLLEEYKDVPVEFRYQASW